MPASFRVRPRFIYLIFVPRSFGTVNTIARTQLRSRSERGRLRARSKRESVTIGSRSGRANLSVRLSESAKFFGEPGISIARYLQSESGVLFSRGSIGPETAESAASVYERARLSSRPGPLRINGRYYRSRDSIIPKYIPPAAPGLGTAAQTDTPLTKL